MKKWTKGEWEVVSDKDTFFSSHNTLYVTCNDKAIAEIRSILVRVNDNLWANQDEANAKLIAEAGTIASQTGLTPKQLLEQRDRLLEACKMLCVSHEAKTDEVKKSSYLSAVVLANEAIKSCEGK